MIERYRIGLVEARKLYAANKIERIVYEAIREYTLRELYKARHP